MSEDGYAAPPLGAVGAPQKTFEYHGWGTSEQRSWPLMQCLTVDAGSASGMATCGDFSIAAWAQVGDASLNLSC